MKIRIEVKRKTEKSNDGIKWFKWEGQTENSMLKKEEISNHGNEANTAETKNLIKSIPAMAYKFPLIFTSQNIYGHLLLRIKVILCLTASSFYWV